MKPTFPEQAAGRPVVQEQAIVGLSEEGDAAVAELTDADGMEPRLALLIFDHAGGPTRTELVAPAPMAKAVSGELQASGRTLLPLLGPLVASRFPQAAERAADLGFFPRVPAVPEPGRARWDLQGSAANGAIPLVAHLETSDAAVLWLSEKAAGESGELAELARMNLAGAPVAAQLYLQGRVAWLVSGSVHPAAVLHRTVGVRRGSIARGESELHDNHGLADYSAGDLDAARREFDRAIAADPTFVDALYNAASAAALSDRTDDAVALLYRAAAVDPGRVQVLGRNDEDLRVLRKRPDIRALLGLKRLPREDIPPPP